MTHDHPIPSTRHRSHGSGRNPVTAIETEINGEVGTYQVEYSFDSFNINILSVTNNEGEEVEPCYVEEMTLMSKIFAEALR